MKHSTSIHEPKVRLFCTKAFLFVSKTHLGPDELACLVGDEAVLGEAVVVILHHCRVAKKKTRKKKKKKNRGKQKTKDVSALNVAPAIENTPLGEHHKDRRRAS